MSICYRGCTISCVEKIKHVVPHCTSEKGLQVFYDENSGRYSGYCFSCSAKGLEAYVANPYEEGTHRDPPKKKSREEIEAEIAEIRSLNYPNFSYRGIREEYFKQAGIRMAFSEYDGKTPNSFNFPYTLKGKLVRYKTIVLKEKVMWSVGDGKEVDLFNWELAKKKGSKRLYITEGEWDCLSLEQILDQHFGQNGKYKHAVVSLPNGAGSAVTTLGRMRKEIETLFDEVVLVFDNDEPGSKAARDVQKIWPEILEAPHVSGIKDANEALNSKSAAVFADYVRWKARKPPIQGVVTVSEIMSKLDGPETKGYSYPWETLDSVLYGQYFGESICIAGGVGSGKTAMAHELIAHNMIKHKLPCFAILLEEVNKKTVRNICGKIDNLLYSNPNVLAANEERFHETARQLEDRLYVWNSEGNTSIRFDIKEILAALRYNHLEYGCMMFYIDNMTKLVDGLTSAEANEYINKYSSELANLASELGINVCLFSHLNTPAFGPDHEHGGQVFLSQLTGSKGIMRSFATALGFERNQYAEGGKDQNSFIRVLKNREHGDKIAVKTQYSKTSGRLLEYNWEGDSLITDKK